MTNPTPEQRRARHLAAGRELLRRHDPVNAPPSLALAHVRLPDVAADQGVRNGAVYHYWNSHLDFWRDLLELLDANGRLTEGIRAATSRCRSVGTRPTPQDIWALGDDMFEAINGDGVLPVALATLAFEADDVSRPSLHAAADLAVSRIEAFLRNALPSVALAIRDDRDHRRLATALLGLLIGLSMQHRIDPVGIRRVPLLPDRPVTLYAAAASALILESCDVVGVTDDLLDELRPLHGAS